MSFFDSGLGLEYFEKEKVDIAIIEVGMGGRLDATNIITPLVSVITNIGLDHTQFLGNTLDAIAFEKAG
jgi:dihydrofolate synthase/folylpolyglutamate synthase